MEHCIYCAEPTGQDGPSDNSLYCAECEDGPYCNECFDGKLGPCCNPEYL